MNVNPDRPGAIIKLFRVLVIFLTAFLVLQLISIYLSWPQQLILGTVSVLLGLIVNRLSTSRVVTVALMLISMTATLRYGWWRVHLLIDYFSDQSNNRIGIDSAFMLLLIAAEAYTVMIMFLGYMQTAWPLQRKPIPMPADDTLWPHVDVLIPTYNEPLSLVRYTALAAIDIDYPPEKLHVYILDDGTREDFAEFSQMAGVGYITREQHSHAKAGNINHALTTMNSPYVAIFDCDHVPTRSFLQMTLGWMLADPLLAMLQTPHHFYSPDPFERNLLQYKTIPNEAELFYGIVQDGNDFWNATFFCGSCAVLRRSALDEVGGIATETVTEDAHTSLRMQKRGYNTAYINLPQAAGLATESLAAHVGQRIRWARGMIQILRTDNPLFSGKMKFTQRLCYFNAMAHFLYAVPRLVFLGAPLVYLLLGRTIIPGYWVAILVYALPHLVLASLTNSRIQEKHRHSFWNEIYEAVLAPYILAPTLLALINPKLGSFNVTSKGNTLGETQFDSKIAAPTKWILFLNFLGILAVPYRLLVTDQQHTGAVLMNLFWILFNMVILGVAAAVAYEQKQRRESVRIEARIPIRIDLADGRQIEGMSIDMSIGGASIELSQDAEFASGDTFKLAFPKQAGDAEIDAAVVGIKGKELRLAFSLPTIRAQETLTRALYSRADAWIGSLDNKEADRPLISLGRVIRLSVYGIYQVLRSLIPERDTVAKAGSASIVALIFTAFTLGAWSQSNLASQVPGTPNTGKPDARQVPYLPAINAPARRAKPPLDPLNGAPIESASNNPAGTPQVLNLKDMGLTHAMELRGPHSYYSLHFTLSNVLVPRHANLKLLYSFDPTLYPRMASLGIILNGIAIATVPITLQPDSRNGYLSSDISIPDALLVRSNTLTFEFTGNGVMQREGQARERVYARISPVTRLEVTGDRLSWKSDLSQLPLPIFDPDLQTATTVPFVFLSQPSLKTLQAAGILASWLGMNVSTKPVHFSVSIGQIPPGNVVVFSDNPSQLLSALQIPPGANALLALRANPSDAYGQVLVVAGKNEDEELAVAQALSITKRTSSLTPSERPLLNGDTAQFQSLTIPAARKRGDAPRWLPLSRAAQLTNCQSQNDLQSDGSNPIPIYFHIPPDLYYGEEQNVQMHLHYRYNALPLAQGSALRVFINGVLINEIPLAPGPGQLEGQRTILVPVANLRPFGNTILFNYDFIPARVKKAQDPTMRTLRGEILCNSTLDLHGLALWTSMPNLELFANAGFPFTRLADLSETTVVLPVAPSSDEIALYLHLMSQFGSQTGYPALRVSVAEPNAIIDSGRDYLILGTVANQPAFNSLDSLLPVTLEANGVHVKQAQGYLSSASSIKSDAVQWMSGMLGRPIAPELPSNGQRIPDALIEEVVSPSSPDRSIVIIELKQNSSADLFADALLEHSQSQDITGSATLQFGSELKSYQLSVDAYHVGDITQFRIMRIWLTQHFLLLLFVVTLLSFLVAYWVYGWMSFHAHERLRLAQSVKYPNK